MADSARRIQRDVRKLERDPPDLVLGFGLQAKSKWLRVALQGPPETPYDRGVYIVQIDIPAHYPHKAPKIKVLTENGRFETQKQICVDGLTSMHEESWNPLQTFNSICIAFVSFMSEDVVGYAGIKRSAAQRRALAARSDAFNEEAGLYKGLKWVRDKPAPPGEAGAGAGAGARAGAEGGDNAGGPGAAVRGGGRGPGAGGGDVGSKVFLMAVVLVVVAFAVQSLKKVQEGDNVFA